MSRIVESISVNVPLHTAYNQWTQFEEFPQFMEGVREVVQIDDTTLRWKARIGGQDKEWMARIVDQVPDRRVSWQATEGAENAGTVTFDPLGDDQTKVNLEMDVEPEGPVESAGDALGMVARQAKEDLERFKQFIESRGRESGAWRGEVRGGREAGRDPGTISH